MLPGDLRCLMNEQGPVTRVNYCVKSREQPLHRTIDMLLFIILITSPLGSLGFPRGA